MAVIFLDLETTGLDPANDRILEIACAHVDAQLQPLAGWHSVIRPNPGIALAMDDPYVRDMHTQNGLLAELEAGVGLTISEAQPQLAAWLAALGPGPHTLAGDSVHFDLGFLRSWMPVVAEMFSHRLLDVSAFRVAREHLGMPIAAKGPGAHRAREDVMASIEKLRYYASRMT